MTELEKIRDIGKKQSKMLKVAIEALEWQARVVINTIRF